jgi:hypothetical protein
MKETIGYKRPWCITPQSNLSLQMREKKEYVSLSVVERG